MTDRSKNLDDLVGGGLEHEERGRLQQAHDLLVQAGPPPELSPALAKPPVEERPTAIPFPRRRRWTAMTGVAAAAVVLLAIGYGIGNRNDVRPPVQTVPLSGSAGASGSIEVFAADDNGNWAMNVSVSGLPPTAGAGYQLWLTRAGALADVCGTFAADGGSANVRLSAPYVLSEYDGWVVVPAGGTEPLLGTAGSAARYRGPSA